MSVALPRDAAIGVVGGVRMGRRDAHVFTPTAGTSPAAN